MGHHNRRYVGDPQGANGAWGQPSSKANFCEEDYAVTLYVAEFINTFTNIAYIWFAFRHPRKEGAHPPQGLDLMSWALVVLGINSFIFHATLNQFTQFCDELAMLVLGSALLHGIFTINRSPAVTKAITSAILAVATTAAAVYLKTANILHHVVVFNSMMLLVGAQTMVLIFDGSRSGTEKKRLMGLFGKAVACLVLAYTLWQIDLEKCLPLRALRDKIGLPWSWLLELHGWWHVLTALGASRYIRLIRELS